MKYAAAVGLVALSVALPVSANEYQPAMQAYYESDIANWMANQVIVDAINAQNATTLAYDQARIDTLDQAWRAEVGTDSAPTITPVLTNPTSDHLRSLVDASGGRITEIFIMDGMGLNVAVSDTTSDYWQGDEAKFTETHGAGPGTVHYGDVEFDESSQSYQGQISVTITDPVSGEAIGAMTVGIDAESLL